MLDRTGRVVFGSFLAFVLVLTIGVVAESQFGVSLADYPFLSFLLFAGAVATPQLYLAVTDDEVPTRGRVQFAAIATAVLAVAFAATADGVRYLLIATVGACAITGLVWYELLVAYRASSDESGTHAR